MLELEQFKVEKPILIKQIWKLTQLALDLKNKTCLENKTYIKTKKRILNIFKENNEPDQLELLIIFNEEKKEWVIDKSNPDTIIEDNSYIIQVKKRM